jgi:hypothetical protein
MILGLSMTLLSLSRRAQALVVGFLMVFTLNISAYLIDNYIFFSSRDYVLRHAESSVHFQITRR